MRWLRVLVPSLRRRVHVLPVRAAAFGVLLAAVVLPLTGAGEATQEPTPTPRVTTQQEQQKPPNVVIVLTDDQRLGLMERMPKVQHLLVDKGTHFTRAMVPTSLCCPSRTTILTGEYAHSSGVYSNHGRHGGWPTFRRHGLERKTLAVSLHERGYRTALIGKYLNGFRTSAPKGYKPAGWDRFTTYVSKAGEYYDYTLSDGTHHGSRPRDYSTDVFRRKAVSFVHKTPADKPLFLYFTPFAPHSPYIPAPRHRGAWTGRLPAYHPPSVTSGIGDKPPWFRGLGPVPRWKIDKMRARQQEMLMSVDDSVGALVRALKETGRMRNTLFVFMSDNGYLWGDHRLPAKKNLPYRFATDIPMVVRWDGHTTPGRRDPRLALNVDVTTTIDRAASAGMATEGLDLLGARRRSGFVLEASTAKLLRGQPMRPAYCGYRTRNAMYARYASGEEELYSYPKDRWEVHNRAHDPRWRDRLRAMRAHAKATCVPTPPGFHW